MAASYCGLLYVDDVVTAEARALLHGLILAGQVGCNSIEVESDCIMNMAKTVLNSY